MNEQIEVIEEKNSTVIEPVLNIGRKAVYLGLGTVGVVADSVKKTFSKSGEYSGKLVKRGETLASDTRGRVGKAFNGGQDIAKDTVKKAGATVNKTSEQVLNNVKIATSKDIDSLTKQVTNVEGKLDKAVKEGVAATSSKNNTTA